MNKISNLGGYMGKLLRVDLSTGKLWDEAMDETTLRLYVGGMGLGTKIVYDEVPPGIEWDSPENRLVFTTGVLTGTRIPGSGTYTVVTKGPLVNGMVCAQSNGLFGARMKFAGYDAMVMQGAAPQLSYLYLDEGEAELRDASHLVGLDCYETEAALIAETGIKQASVACIGPAGENKVRYATIGNDKGHLAACGGVGAVMGAKMLKAIVVHGKERPSIYDEVEYKKQVAIWKDCTMEHPMTKRFAAVGTYGTGGHGKVPGVVPVKNWTETTFPDDQYNVNIHRPLYNTKPRACWACPIAHCRDLTIPDGKYAGEHEEPEAESKAAWSSLTGINDPAATIYLASLCDKLGIDTKEAGFTVSMAQECYTKGLLTKDQTDGLELDWGNIEAIDALLRKIAVREGWIGNALAEGAMRAAQAIGGDATKFAIHFGKGNAPHVHESRGMAYHMFSQTVADLSSHVGIGVPFDPDMGYATPVASFDPDALSKFIADTAPKRLFEECLGVCDFVAYVTVDIMAAAVNSVTGFSMTRSDCLEVGERIASLQRAFNLRHGKTAADDSISPRMQEGPKEGVSWVSIAPHMEKMKSGYYKMMGWEEITSKPLPDTLKRLKMESVIQDLWC